jgi:hypothetical protein
MQPIFKAVVVGRTNDVLDDFTPRSAEAREAAA